jgi:molecular chaperone GrpE
VNDADSGSPGRDRGRGNGAAQEQPRLGSDTDVKVVDRRWWAREAAGDEDEAEPSSKPSYVQELEQQVAEKDRLLQSTVAKYREAASEFDEVRLRLRREIAKDIERARRSVIVELLDVLDNLDRSIDAARTSSTGALLQGVEMIRDQFLAKLDGLGVRRIESIGAVFDPVRHEAISAVPTLDAAEDGRIVGVIRHGYTIGDEVLRPAAVAVVKSEPQ